MNLETIYAVMLHMFVWNQQGMKNIELNTNWNLEPRSHSFVINHLE